MPALLFAALLGYLLGALPFGWLIARKFGINIFEHGSGNPGATNVKRVLGEKFGPAGKRAGDFAFILDAVKGATAAGWPFWIYNNRVMELSALARRGEAVSAELADAHLWVYAALVGLLFALIGHSFSCFTKFKGGKGVATSAGGLLVLLPLPTLIGLAAWLTLFYLSRYVSLASLVAAVALPVAAWVLPGPTPFAALATLLGLIVIARHRTNISRLLAGTEHKFVKPPSDPSP